MDMSVSPAVLCFPISFNSQKAKHLEVGKELALEVCQT